MNSNSYDAIVVGARVAGSPTAMLLARKGYKVLLVDRATFPSDTLSTHLVHAPGVAALERWGLLDRLHATGAPPIERYSFDFGPFTISGTPLPSDGNRLAYGPRRTVLDKLLLEAAAEAGAEVREGFVVEEILSENGRVTGIRGRTRNGNNVTDRARIVVGADGRHSRVAGAVNAERYNEKPRLQQSYYTYWSGLPLDGVEVYIRPHRSWAAIPTNDELTLVVVGWPYAEVGEYKLDIEGNYLKTLELAPEFAERLGGAKREAPFAGGANMNGFRKPFGDGWALVGDAGYEKDSLTAQGITDAFRDAELVVAAVDEWSLGVRSFDEAMSAYQATRDEQATPVFEFTAQMATMDPPSPEMQQLLGAVHGNQDAMDEFVSIIAGTVSPADFFAEENVGRIMTAAQAPAAS